MTRKMGDCFAIARNDSQTSVIRIGQVLYDDMTYAVAYQQDGLEGGTPSRIKHPAAGRRSHRGNERRPAGG